MGQILFIPGALIAGGAILGGIIVGLLYVVGIFGSTKKSNTKEAEQANEYVIQALKEKIEVLEQKVEEGSTRLQETNKRLDLLQGENQSLRDVLQGKDAATKEYRAEVQKTMVRAEQILNLTQQTHQNVERLYQVIEKFLETAGQKP